MDPYSQLDEFLQRLPAVQTTVPSIIAYAIGAILFLHQALVYLDVAVLSPLEIVWNAVVYVTPVILLLGTERRRELREQQSTWSQTHAAKSDALRKMLSVRSRAVMPQLPAVRSLTAGKSKPGSDAPPGLGNWDNSCYQNSVLQGLSTMDSLKPYLSAFSSHKALPADSTSSSLEEVVRKLNDASNNGSHIWTPAKLKSMSSWTQQDAQEYYSKIVDDLEKEASKVFGAAAVKPGLESSGKKTSDLSEQLAAPPFSVPLEGLLAQRVACTRCGFSEGLSMIPFNCLTVPLGSGYEYDLADCLNEYTQLEDIPEVECAKCTLLKAKIELNKMLPQSKSDADAENSAIEAKKPMQLSPALQEMIERRLKAVTEALDSDDFSDKTLKEDCQISKKARASSIKTRQAVIGRAPRSLVVHVNRSVFDEMTGDQRKNYAAVRYPQVLDLGKWMLGSKTAAGPANVSDLPKDQAVTDASESMLSSSTERDECLYRLKAVITHYGRHENGHYIAYRQHPPASHAPNEPNEDEFAGEPEDLEPLDDGKLPWWRLSDEDVSSVPDEDVLKQGGVFMLFYEREEHSTALTAKYPAADATETQESAHTDTASIVEQPVDTERDTEMTEVNATAAKTNSFTENINPTPASETSTGNTTEEDSEADTQKRPVEVVKTVPTSPTQPRMRTANDAQSDSGFPAPHRVVAAT